MNARLLKACLKHEKQLPAEINELAQRQLADDPFATAEEITEARDRVSNTYSLDSNDVEIDDEALTRRADDGLWVSAWIWLPRPDEDDE